MILPAIAFILTCSIGLMLSALPAYFVYIREKRLRKLAESKLKISSAVSGMQEHMLDGKITGGHVCHDELFELMQFVQASETYPLRINVWNKPSPESQAFALRVEKDLEDSNSPYAQTLVQFIDAYYSAFKYRHPIILARTYVLLLFSSAFLNLLLKTIKLTMKGLVVIETVQKDWKKLKTKKVRRALIVATYRYVMPMHQMSFNEMPPMACAR